MVVDLLMLPRLCELPNVHVTFLSWQGAINMVAMAHRDVCKTFPTWNEMADLEANYKNGGMHFTLEFHFCIIHNLNH